MALPLDLFLAATERRVVLWEDGPSRRRPIGSLVGSLRYGADIQWVRAVDKRDTTFAPWGKTYLAFGVGDAVVELEVSLIHVERLADVVQGHLPGTNQQRDRRSTDVPAAPSRSGHAGPPVQTPGFSAMGTELNVGDHERPSVGTDPPATGPAPRGPDGRHRRRIP